jgi:hypothetical protein
MGIPTAILDPKRPSDAAPPGPPILSQLRPLPRTTVAWSLSTTRRSPETPRVLEHALDDAVRAPAVLGDLFALKVEGIGVSALSDPADRPRT